jgi:protocatechuate 3,4-dioxygenase beta subunit
VLAPPGRIIVNARGPGLPEGTAETFAAPGPLRDLTIRVALPESFPATIRVTDEHGTALPGATITELTWGRNLWGVGGRGANPDEPSPPVVVTDEDGRARLPLARSARSKVRAAKDGYTAIEDRIPVRSGTETAVVLYRAGSVEGRVLMADGRPAPAGLIIWAGTEGYDVPRDQHTGPGGTFSIDALVPGKVSVWFHNGPFSLGHFEVDLEPGRAILGIEHRLTPQDTLRGIVREEGSGAPIPGVVVGSAEYWVYSSAGIVTDADGRWIVDWVEPDRPDWKRDIGFSHPDYRVHRELIRAGTRQVEVFLTPAVGVWTHDPDIEIPEADAEEWTLTITDPAGEPIPDAWVEIGERRKLYRPTDAAGRVRIPEDAEHVYACATGHTRRRVFGPDQAAGTIALEPTTPIRMRVVDREGRPRAGVEVRVYHPHRLATTDAAGRVAFDGLPMGKALYVTAADGLGPNSSMWATAGGEERTLVVPRTTRVIVRFKGEPPNLGPDEHVSCDVYSRERIEPRDGTFDGTSVDPVRRGNAFEVGCPAEKIVLWFAYPNGPLRAYRLDLSDGAEQAVEYSLGAPEMGAITVLDARGDPVPKARITALAGYSHILTHRPIGRIRLVVEPDGQAPQVTPVLDTSEPNLVRLLPVGTVRVTVLQHGVRFGEGKLRIHSETGAVGDWVQPTKSGDFEVPYGVPAGRRRIEYRPPNGMPRFATVDVTDGRETEVILRLP